MQSALVDMQTLHRLYDLVTGVLMGDRDKLVTDYIQSLKESVGADTDPDLAQLLSIDKRTVSAWRSMGGVCLNVFSSC